MLAFVLITAVPTVIDLGARTVQSVVNGVHKIATSYTNSQTKKMI